MKRFEVFFPSTPSSRGRHILLHILAPFNEGGASKSGDRFKQEAIVMKPVFTQPASVWIVAFTLVAIALIGILNFAPILFPQLWNRSSADKYASNIYYVKRACVSTEGSSSEFTSFCGNNLIEGSHNIFLKPRSDLTAPAAKISVNERHDLYRFLGDALNAKAIFGSINQRPENRIAAYVYIECAISHGQSRELAGFDKVSWSFDRSLKSYCAELINH